MRKTINVLFGVLFGAMVFSTTVSADEGYVQKTPSVVFFEEEATPEPEPAPQEPEVQPEPEPAPQEPEVQPEPEPAPQEPEVQPEPEPAPQEPEVQPEPQPAPQEPEVQPEPEPAPQEPEVQPEPTPQPQPSNNDESGEAQPASQPTQEENTEPAVVTETVVAPVVEAQAPVAPVVATSAVATKTATKAAVVEILEDDTFDDVLGVLRTQESSEDEEIIESDETDNAGITFIFGILALLGLLGALAAILLGKRNYVVVRRFHDENGADVEELKKFRNIEKACEYVRDYQWDTEDDTYDALNILNISRDEAVEDEDGNVENQQIVYVVSEDKEQQAIIFANDNEVDAIGRILNFVQEDAAIA